MLNQVSDTSTYMSAIFGGMGGKADMTWARRSPNDHELWSLFDEEMGDSEEPWSVCPGNPDSSLKVVSLVLYATCPLPHATIRCTSAVQNFGSGFIRMLYAVPAELPLSYCSGEFCPKNSG